MVQVKINIGGHTDHPAGCQSIWTNQCPPPPSPIFLQAGCPSCRPTNSIKALKAVSKLNVIVACYLWNEQDRRMTTQRRMHLAMNPWVRWTAHFGNELAPRVIASYRRCRRYTAPAAVWKSLAFRARGTRLRDLCWIYACHLLVVSQWFCASSLTLVRFFQTSLTGQTKTFYILLKPSRQQTSVSRMSSLSAFCLLPSLCNAWLNHLQFLTDPHVQIVSICVS